MTLRPIDPAPLRARYSGRSADAGERPELQWVKIAKLRIDPRYQREIGQRGANNILRIASAFQWAKFAPVVAAPIGSGLFAIVDGQHRTTAAALCEFESVPCVIISADEAQQADAFVAINANVTQMSPLQLHAAQLAAGYASATQLTEVCSEAGVTICRYPVPANKIKPGETLAVAMLQAVLDKYGREVLISALCCITKTRKGNAGMIRKQIVEALCAVLEAEPAWRADRVKLIFAMQTFDFASQFTTASARAIERGEKISAALVKAIDAHLERRLQGVTGGEEDEEAEERQVPAAPALKPNPVTQAERDILNNVIIPPAPDAERWDNPRNIATTAPERSMPVVGELAIGRDHVVRGRHRINISPRAALLVTALYKAKASFVDDSFLIAKIWTARPANAQELLDALIRDLSCLREIRFEIESKRGLGRRLVEVKA